MSATAFADSVLAAMRASDPSAARLLTRSHGSDAAVVGIESGGKFVVLFRLGGASGKFNVMSLQVSHPALWMRIARGTPAMLAKTLLGPAQSLWKLAVMGAQPSENSDE